MKTKLLVILAFLFIAAGCGNDKTESESDSATRESKQIVKYTEPTGIYHGILPCASCESIDYTLVLSAQNRFKKTMTYLGQDEPLTFTEMGSYTLNDDKSLLTLQTEDGEVRYQLKEGVLSPIDLQGNIIKSESGFDYTLKKIGEIDAVIEAELMSIDHTDNYESFDDGHNAANSLSYEGMYKGVIPCASCEGIEVVVEIDYQGHYKQRTTYLGQKDAVYFEEGEYQWNNEGNRITLLNSEFNSRYFVGEDRLFLLDSDGEIVESVQGLNYILEKKSNEIGYLKSNSVKERAMESDEDLSIKSTIPVKKDEPVKVNSLDKDDKQMATSIAVYTATLPCIDCTAVSVLVEFFSDNTYHREVSFLGTDEDIRIDEGRFMWNHEENIVQLSNDDPNLPNRYVVGKNELHHINADGRIIKTERGVNYSLILQQEK